MQQESFILLMSSVHILTTYIKNIGVGILGFN